MQHRLATADDCELLAELNHQLIADECHSNTMNPAELEQRMRALLAGEYQATLFLQNAEVVAYALYRDDDLGRVHLRQFFVDRQQRRRGVGREAFGLFRSAVVPRDRRIMIEVLVGNAAARAFWNALGFHDYALTMEHRLSSLE